MTHEDVSQSETVGFLEEALDQADNTEPRPGTLAKSVPKFVGEVRKHPDMTEVDYVKPKTDYQAKQGTD